MVLMTMRQHEFRVKPEEAGERLDRLLALIFPEGSRSFWQKHIKNADVLVNDKIAKSSQILETDDLIRININESEQHEVIAAPQLHVIYEDQDLAVIEKAAGVVTHAAPGHRSGTLAESAQNYFGSKLSDLAGSNRRGIVHRLDKDTSGLLLIAKSNEAHRGLAAAFKKHDVLREYEAIVMGVPESRTGLIDAPLARDPQDRKRMSVQAGGKEAQTYFELLADNKELSHLRLRLQTGRTHQIRVHLAMIGCPVLNDEKYGGRRVRVLEEDDILLHAVKLAFTHPVSGERLSFSSELPLRFDSFLRKIYMHIN